VINVPILRRPIWEARRECKKTWRIVGWD